MRVKMHVKKGDTVLVASGKYKGRVGKYAVIVEGVNIVKKAVRVSPKYPQGGFIEKEAPLHASKVRPICPACGKPTRVRKKFLENGKKIRVCAKCGGALDTEE